jgi:ribosomal protein S4
MKLLVAVFSLLFTSVLFSQENTDSIHFNYLNTSLSLTDKEQSHFWDRYDKMKQEQTQTINSQRDMKKSLMYAFAKSDEEIKSIIAQIAEQDILKVRLKRDFMIDCVDLLDAERAIKFSIYEKKFKKMTKSDNLK